MSMLIAEWAAQGTTVPKHDALLFMNISVSTGLFFAPLHCLPAEQHQCEILLDIITHYYLLEFDFLVFSFVFYFLALRQFALTSIARLFDSFVWSSFFVRQELLLFCFGW